MIRSLNTAATGMKAQQQEMDVRANNIARMLEAGWIYKASNDDRYCLTVSGRRQAEVSTFVRAFSEGV